MSRSSLPALDDILAFMEEEERLAWDTATEEERAELRKTLEEEWHSIPDPTIEDLKPPYSHPNDWAAYEQGGPVNREQVFNFHKRRWKKQRRKSIQPLLSTEERATAAAEESVNFLPAMEETVETIEGSLPEGKPDRGNLNKVIEITVNNRPTDSSDFWKDYIEAERNRTAETIRNIQPVRPPQRALHAQDVEDAVERAIRKEREAEESPLPLPTPTQDHRVTKGDHTTLFWNGTAVLVAILAVMFWSALFVLSWGLYMAWVFRAPWFLSESKDQRFVYKGIIATGISAIFLYAWLYLVARPSSFSR